MLIILEGVDGAGKTTLANRLVAELRQRHPSARVRLLHKGPPTLHPLAEYEGPLFDYLPGTGEHVVCDRWHLGEIVYPPVLGRESQLTPEAAWHIELYLERLGALLVHVDAPLEVLASRLDFRGDDLIKVPQLAELRARYELVLERTLLPTHTVQGNGLGDSRLYGDCAAADVIRRAEQQEDVYRDLRKYVTYAGARHPSLLLLGDVRNWLHWQTRRSPAFLPYPNTSGQYLLRALRPYATPLRRLGLANACDVDDPVALWHDLGEPETVALGMQAHGLLGDELPHRLAYHPQFIRRFHHRRIDNYADSIVTSKPIDWRVGYHLGGAAERAR